MRRNIKGTFALIFAFMLLFSGCSPEQTTPDASAGAAAGQADGGRNILSVCGVDQFGRAFMPVSGLNEKQVGIYYFLWHGNDAKMTGQYNITSLLKEHPDDLWNPEGTKNSPLNTFHYWNEPLFGYYRSDDKWVLAKHMEMLTLAGVDFLYLDATNADPYSESFKNLAAVLKSMYKAGWNAPKVAFYTNSYSILTIERIYKLLYKSGRYDEVWYRPDGEHPMIIGNITPASDKAEAKRRGDTEYDPQPLSKELTEYFDLRVSQWPDEAYMTAGFPWMEWSYPQPIHIQPDGSGMMSVSLAQHPQLPVSNSIKNRALNRGRGYDYSKKVNVRDNVRLGTNAQSQWDNVLDKIDKVDLVTVTGWNEWVAIKQVFDGRVGFVDTADEEFSRDIEPPKGDGYQDAFYLQLCDNIRRFKGIKGDMPKPALKSLPLAPDPAAWEGCAVYATAALGLARSSAGVGQNLRYEQPAPRNKIKSVRAANDKSSVQFLIECENALQECAVADFMNLYIGCGTPSLKGWESYSFAASPCENALYSLDEKGARTRIGDIQSEIRDNCITLTVSLADIGAPADGIYFKVTDGFNGTDIMDTYTQGSCLPMGRLSLWYPLG